MTNSSTFVETSSTAMFFVGLSQGWQNGWLDEVEHAAALLNVGTDAVYWS